MKSIILIVLLSFFSVAFAQEELVWIHPNKGQWEDVIKYRVDLANGKMYIETDGFTFNFHEPIDQHSDESNHSEEKEKIKAHALRTKFLGSSWSGKVLESKKSGHYINYFLGNDSQKWKSEVYAFGQTVLKDYYPGIDMNIEGGNAELKYSFIVQPNRDYRVIKMNIEGASRSYISENGDLHMTTTLGEVIEKKPVAWTLKDGKKTMVNVRFKIDNDIVVYDFPNGYDTQEILVIDPSLIFSTFTGSTSDNWGMTATPGPNGEMYAGGICFGIGYPLTAGAYDLSYNGGTPNANLPGFDVAISKFNDIGTQLLFSTYFGGNANELPESMITGTNGDLYVLGITASPNFPISSGAYDNTFSGGPQATENSLKFMGTDIYVAHFNANGTAIIGSTFIGGSNSDGLNSSILHYNYGDQFRGEIILDGMENVYVASNTKSTDFPVTNGSTLLGLQDAVVFKMSSNLTSLIWSTYYGGTGVETGNSLELSSSGELFVAGGTSSSNLPINGGFDGTFGGVSDGYLAKFNINDGAFIRGTYMGDAEYDQTYFVKLDIDDFVYVYGQTETSWAISPGCYGNPNSGQFLRKYTNDLTAVSWTTMFGAGTGHPEISPTALLISDCYDIFISGWGGNVNQNGPAAFSTSNGFPVTTGAYQSVTNGSNFYLGIFGVDASTLVYGTFMGGTSNSFNHVDGGTSRFDKSGAVYHAVCAACGANPTGFTTTPGAWSNTNPSNNCNLAAFKFQLGEPYSLSANSTVCSGDPVQLSASGGISYSWSPAASLSDPNSANPIATPTQTTVYYVDMDFNEGCAIVDSVIVTVIGVPAIDINSQSVICSGDTTVLSASGNGLTYNWTPNTTINNPTLPNVLVWPAQSQYYYCTVTNECFTNNDSIYVLVHPLPELGLIDDIIICSGDQATINVSSSTTNTWEPSTGLTVVSNTQITVATTSPKYFYVNGVDANGCEKRDSVFVDVYPIPLLIVSNDTSVCYTESATLSASGMDSYSWTPIESLNNPNVSNPIATPLTPTTYTVTGTYAAGCKLSKNIHVDLLYLPVPILPDTLVACYGVSETLTAGGADSYTWSPGTYLDNTTGSVVHATAADDITYTVGFTNICGTVYKDVFLDVIVPNVTAFNDTIVCPGRPAYLYAIGGAQYIWSPASGLNSIHSSGVTAIPTVPTEYQVIGIDVNGCRDTAFVFVDLYPLPFIQTSPDAYLLEGESVQLSAWSYTSGPYEWSPSEYLSCINCVNPTASPPTDFQYVVSYTDENGCSASDDVWIFFKPLIWVPNTFTPDGNGVNDGFKVVGGNVAEMKLQIFNRWGELVTTLNHITESWDGKYKGNICQDGTYTWKLYYKDLKGNESRLVGHVNVLR